MLKNVQTIICISNGSETSNSIAEDIANKYKLTYCGLLNNNTVLTNGCYYTSIFDIKLQELITKVKSIDNVKVIVLDHNKSDYNNIREFYDTIDLGQALVDIAEVEFVNAEISNPFRQIIEKNKSFCILPFNTINIGPTNGKIRHCCWMTPLESNYENFYSDVPSVNMRQKIVAGNQIENCKKCYAVEKLGAISERQNQTIQWTYKLGLKSLDDVKPDLVNYELSLGNKCNLMCRMCNPNSSNLIDAEYFNLGLVTNQLNITNKELSNLIDYNTVQKIQVAGGEPSISENFYNVLKKCIEHNRQDVEIFVSSNCVAINKEFITLIKNFDNIKFSISIDGFNLANQYIRWPISWNKFTKNVEKLISVLKPYNYYFNTVVSIYNIARLYEIFDFLEKTYPTSTYGISILQEPALLEPWNFPNKEYALKNLEKIKTLRSYKQNQIFKSRIDAIISHLETCTIDFKKLTEFYKFNDQLDKSRNIKLADYIPELELFRP